MGSLATGVENRKIADAIAEYAAAYSKLQNLQDTIVSIPKGDQKTGCIGEYYAYRYLEYVHPISQLKYGSHSEKGWDIEILDRGLKVQVKTVSAYSKTRVISPIHKGWNILHILYLNKQLEPEGFWIITDTNIFGASEKLTGKTCRHPQQPGTGSKDLPFGENRIDELLRALNG